MKKLLGIAALCACLFLPQGVSAQETAPADWDEKIDVPGISEEIEALTGEEIQAGEKGSKRDAAEEETENLYRLLRKDAALSAIGTVDMPVAYDPRSQGKVTPVKNQILNTCWACSALAAGEQSLVYKGLADPAKLDLSEAHLAYFFYHPEADPLGNTAGDGNRNISSLDFLSAGSNTIFATFALANWIGAAEEDLAPFDGLTPETVYDASLAYKDAAHLQNAYWINFKDVDAAHVIKQMITKYGGAAINLYWDKNRYLNDSSYAYYFPLDPERANNHSVTIVGWDDAFSRERFREDCRPAGDGAWIVKNSYGEDWGDGGYFYLSYEDSSVNSKNTNANRARAYIFDFERSDNYDHNYQYDGSAGAYNATNPDSSLTRVDSRAKIANVFTVQKKETAHAELLKAVSFALFDTAVSYRIQVYKNPVNVSDPSSGTPMLAAPAAGSTSYAGYYTVPLAEPVLLQEGDTFSVEVSLEKESGGQINFFVDKSYQNGDWISFTNDTEPGQSFRYVNGKWEDMAYYGITARVKAFTDDADASAVSIPVADGTVSSTVKKGAQVSAKEKNTKTSGIDPNGVSESSPSASESSPGTSESAPSASSASPTKSANTFDDSGQRVIFWAAVLFIGMLLIYKERRKTE